MTILKNNLTRMFRDIFNLIIMVVMPVAFIIMFVLSGNSVSIRVGVVDNDNTFFTEKFINELKKNSMVVSLKESEIKERLLNNDIEYAIAFYDGFTEDIISGKDVAIKGYELKDFNHSIPVKLYVDSFLNSAKTIAEFSHGDEKTFKKGLEYYLEGQISTYYLNASHSNFSSGKALSSLSIIVMFMMYMGINAASLIMEDKMSKTYERILVSPISIKRYMFENILSSFAVVWIQLLLLLGIIKFVFKIDFGPYTHLIIIFMFIYSSVSVTLGMTVVNLSKNLKQVSSISPLVVIPLCMLGGCFWPIEAMPEILQKLSSYNPVTWTIQGLENIMAAGSLASGYREITILLLFSLVFFLIGSTKKSSLA